MTELDCNRRARWEALSRRLLEWFAPLHQLTQKAWSLARPFVWSSQRCCVDYALSQCRQPCGLAPFFAPLAWKEGVPTLRENTLLPGIGPWLAG